MPSILNATTTNGLVTSADNSGSLQLQTNNGTTAVTIDTSQRAAFVAGTAALPAITTSGDTNTGMFFPAADTIAFAEGGTETMRLDSSGNVGINTSSPASRLDISTGSSTGTTDMITLSGLDNGSAKQTYGVIQMGIENNTASSEQGNILLQTVESGTVRTRININGSGYMAFSNGGTERMRITSGGNLLVGKTAEDTTTAGVRFTSGGVGVFTSSADLQIICNRLTNDGALILFRQDNTDEGSISVSGTTVSYNGGHLSRYAQTIGAKDESLVKGTVLSNLDEMNEYVDAEGNPVDNEQLNKVKVSDVEGDVNVAGVFVNWTYDEAHNVDEINMAMTGDMIIRIAQDVVVQKGDLLMSAGDGTAKPQGDDIVRSKTIAKVTSNHITCTYADGSYCVPCVLMAC